MTLLHQIVCLRVGICSPNEVRWTDRSCHACEDTEHTYIVVPIVCVCLTKVYNSRTTDRPAVSVSIIGGGDMDQFQNCHSRLPYIMMSAQNLHSIFKTTVLSKSQHASPSWQGFTNAPQRDRLEGFLRKSARAGFAQTVPNPSLWPVIWPMTHLSVASSVMITILYSLSSLRNCLVLTICELVTMIISSHGNIIPYMREITLKQRVAEIKSRQQNSTKERKSNIKKIE